MSGAPHTKGAWNGAKVGDEFLKDDIILGAAVFASTSATTDVITHGLSATPTLFFAQTFAADTSTLLMVANSTSVTVTRVVTSATLGYSYLLGVLA